MRQKLVAIVGATFLLTTSLTFSSANASSADDSNDRQLSNSPTTTGDLTVANRQDRMMPFVSSLEKVAEGDIDFTQITIRPRTGIFEVWRAGSTATQPESPLNASYKGAISAEFAVVYMPALFSRAQADKVESTIEQNMPALKKRGIVVHAFGQDAPDHPYTITYSSSATGNPSGPEIDAIQNVAAGHVVFASGDVQPASRGADYSPFIGGAANHAPIRVPALQTSPTSPG